MLTTADLMPTLTTTSITAAAAITTQPGHYIPFFPPINYKY
jgi:hypothetical protein